MTIKSEARGEQSYKSLKYQIQYNIYFSLVGWTIKKKIIHI